MAQTLVQSLLLLILRSPFLAVDYGVHKIWENNNIGVVPHITDAIQEWIERVAVVPVAGEDGPADVCVIELGGTIGFNPESTPRRSSREADRSGELSISKRTQTCQIQPRKV